MPVELQVAPGFDAATLPSEEQFQCWVETALLQVNRADSIAAQDVCIRITDSAESRALNRQYRGSDKPTNVLSFPAQLAEAAQLLDEAEPLPLGDLVIAMPVVTEEAHSQGKSLTAHLTHLVIHGTLHLLGYDHETDDDAQVMEAIETTALAALGIDDPYRLAAGEHA